MKQSIETQYLHIMKKILYFGEEKAPHGELIKSTFFETLRHDFADGFPLLTTKCVYWKGVIAELVWFLRGRTDIQFLHDRNCHIWDPWDDGSGELGPIYGHQWRNFGGIDQLANVIETIKTNPDSRRILVSAWNPVDIPNMALPPCHVLYGFYCHEDGGLSLHLTQRSADWFLGVPFNIASYAALLVAVCHLTNRYPRELGMTFLDAHLYANQFIPAKQQLTRSQKELPVMYMDGEFTLDTIDVDNFVLDGYDPHPTIKCDVVYVPGEKG